MVREAATSIAAHCGDTPVVDVSAGWPVHHRAVRGVVILAVAVLVGVGRRGGRQRREDGEGGQGSSHAHGERSCALTGVSSDLWLLPFTSALGVTAHRRDGQPLRPAPQCSPRCGHAGRRPGLGVAEGAATLERLAGEHHRQQPEGRSSQGRQLAARCSSTSARSTRTGVVRRPTASGSRRRARPMPVLALRTKPDGAR